MNLVFLKILVKSFDIFISCSFLAPAGFLMSNMSLRLKTQSKHVQQHVQGLHERTTTAKNMGMLKYHQTSLKLLKRLAPGMPGWSCQTKPGLASGCQVNIKCLYVKSTCLGSNYRNISSLTLVQKVIPGYFQRTIILAELTCGLFPMVFRG
jgi:hypothetical protein